MRTLSLLFFLLVTFQLPAQVTQRNILSSRYSLSKIESTLIPAADYHPFPTSPDEWKAAVPANKLQQLVQEGEEMLAFRFQPISASVSLTFVRSGDRQEHSDISFPKRTALTKLIVAESIEHRGRFMEAIINGIWSICEESFWGVPAHIGKTGLPDVDHPVVELFSAETGAALALADYLVGPQLDSINVLLRKRIYSETNRRIFIPMITESAQYGWQSKTKPVNNWNPWIHSNWLLSTLLLEKNNKRRAEMIHQSMQGLDSYLNSLGNQGSCDEGPAYWFAAGASVFDCLELLYSGTKGGVNIFSEPLIKSMAGYITKVHIGDRYFVNFADADPTLSPDGIFLYRMGITLQDSALIKMGSWAYQKFTLQAKKNPGSGIGNMKHRFMFNLLSVQKINTGPIFYQPITDSWMEDVQVLTARSKQNLFLAAHGGHNAESHNHNDVGDFIVYLKGEPVIIDAGRGNYTARTFSSKRYELWFTQSNYHNLPLINGYAQLAGRNFAAKDVTCTITPEQAQLSMNISAAYDSKAGIKEWKRQISLDRKNEIINLRDQYALLQPPDSLQQILITPATIESVRPGELVFTTQSGLKMLLKYAAADFNYTIDYPSVVGMEYSSFINKWPGVTIKRLVFHAHKPTAVGNWQFTLQPL
ncbi:MAG: hypothetical protein FGM61_01850 [Sediminibacterium sp.]|nr:hypothetical protein [Sediminibacterium sp.]